MRLVTMHALIVDKPDGHPNAARLAIETKQIFVSKFCPPGLSYKAYAFRKQ